MSTLEPAPAEEDSYMEDTTADRTQPTTEILSALSAVKSEEAAANPSLQTESQAPPLSEYDALTAQLAENPHNPDGWRQLIRIAEETGEIEKISAAYDALLKQYPNNVCLPCIPTLRRADPLQATAQIQYITHFVNDESTFEHAEELFKKFLIRSPCVELWNFYLTYVRCVLFSIFAGDVLTP